MHWNIYIFNQSLKHKKSFCYTLANFPSPLSVTYYLYILCPFDVCVRHFCNLFSEFAFSPKTVFVVKARVQHHHSSKKSHSFKWSKKPSFFQRTETNLHKLARNRFHQHFTSSFKILMCFAHLLCTSSLCLLFLGKRKLATKLWNVGEID